MTNQYDSVKGERGKGKGERGKGKGKREKGKGERGKGKGFKYIQIPLPRLVSLPVLSFVVGVGVGEASRREASRREASRREGSNH